VASHLIHFGFCIATMHSAESVVYAVCVGFIILEQITEKG
jgi:hypothetical protein